MKNKRITLVIIAALMTLIMLAGCAGKYQTAFPMETTAAGRYEAAYDQEFYEGADDATIQNKAASSNSFGRRTNSRNNVAETAAGEPAAKADQATGSNAGGTQNQPNVDPTKGRLLIRTVNMTAETKEFDNVRNAVEDKVKELGGYIERSGVSGTGTAGSLHNATYVIRIPAEKLDELISTVGSNCTVTNSSESTTDVTLNYVDTKARLDSLRVEQEQLTELLKQAKDLDSIIVLQNRLTEIRYQIESAESTLRVLENQVTYATLSLRLREVMEIKPQEPPHVDTYGEKIVKTFKKSLKAIGEFFKGVFLVLVAVSPVLVPLIIITVIGIIILVNAVKKGKKRRAAAQAARMAQMAQFQPQPQMQAQPQVQAQAKSAETKPGEKKAEEKKEEKAAEKE